VQGSCGSTPVGKRGASGACIFNPAVFSVPSGSFGNVGKMSYRLPSFNNLDFSVVKETPLYEGVSLEFRAESFNTYNVVIAGTRAPRSALPPLVWLLLKAARLESFSLAQRSSFDPNARPGFLE
jgi:hypothetical protein